MYGLAKYKRITININFMQFRYGFEELGKGTSN